ncbi:aldo/keto reductase [Amnibacterium kyonggiense]|uniref:Aryl-alcohol dehydrogenase-like predicted oxidoreductase n=1 Tax=Amnibacterium kyonggiense TaxID=595671 RepID=A0A4R7FE76_9MICO|nr:aldo/keto reductase [Amnibacterium kyonggiense]TDS75629.1 aryl-alcohol dehydrogenase-like predicted oxidoreductase [Amnibacterium kyonggiense]
MSRRVGQTGMAVYPLALDGSVFGWATDAKETADQLDLFYAAGGDLISTAAQYAGGRSEIMIGSWLQRHPNRDRLVIATKVGKHPDALGLSPKAVRRGVDASLERLQLDRIDILGLDGEDPATPIEATLTVVTELIAEGKVGHLSAAGFSAAGLREAVKTARRLEIPGIEVVLPEYNLLERRQYEQEIAPIAVAADLGVLAKTPLANGYLRGDFRSRHDKPASPIFQGALKYVNRRGAAVLAVLDDIAFESGQHVGRVALAWLLSRESVVAPLVRVPSARALADLLPGASLVLTRDQLDRLDRATDF